MKNLRVVVTVTSVSAENDRTRKKMKNCPVADSTPVSDLGFRVMHVYRSEIYVYSIESRLIMRVRYDSHIRIR